MSVKSNAGTQGRPRGKKLVVSVAFDRNDLDQVSGAAQRQGVTMSEFVRESAIGRAARGNQTTILSVSGRSGLRGVGEDVTVARRGVRLMSPPNAETY